MTWQTVLVLGLAVCTIGLLIVDVLGKATAPYDPGTPWEPQSVRIARGPHAGRAGNVVTIPWLGNFWGRRLTVNVPATVGEIHAAYGAGYGGRIGELVQESLEGRGPRHWVRCWSWQVERTD